MVKRINDAGDYIPITAITIKNYDISIKYYDSTGQGFTLDGTIGVIIDDYTDISGPATYYLESLYYADNVNVYTTLDIMLDIKEYLESHNDFNLVQEIINSGYYKD